MKHLIRFVLSAAVAAWLTSGMNLPAQQWSRNLPDTQGLEFMSFPTLVDWDNDGDMDVLTVSTNLLQVFNGASGAPLWEMLISLPDTNWNVAGLYGFAHPDLNREALGDFDGNGKADILVAISSGEGMFMEPGTNLLRLYEVSTKTLKWEKDITEAMGYGYPMLGNLDADAPGEIVLFNSGNYDGMTGTYTNRSISVLDGAQGTLQWAKPLPNTSGYSYSYPELVDWNNDGKEEVMLVTGGRVEVFSGVNGDAMFSMDLTLPSPDAEVTGPFGLQPATTRTQVPADLDGNGSKDLLFVVSIHGGMGSSTNLIQLYEIAGATGTVKWQVPGPGDMQSYWLPTANLNSDAAREFVVTTGSYDDISQSYTGQTVSVFSSVNGLAQWTAPLPDGWHPGQPQIADWNSDGKPGVGVRQGNTLRGFAGASGNLQYEITIPLPGPGWELSYLGGMVWADLERMVPADFDGNGSPDFYVVLSAGLPYGSTTNLIRLYNVASKNLLWETPGIVNFSSLRTEDGNLDGDKRREIVYVTGLGRGVYGASFHRTVTVLDGANLGEPPSITTQPQSQNASVGADVTFTAAALGTAPLRFQWRFNGANVAGATGDSLLVPQVMASAAGKYSVVVSNAYGFAVSSNATLVVAAPPLITEQPVSSSVGPGVRAQFGVTAAGTTPLGYQWRFNGTNLRGNTRILGASTRSLAITSAQVADAGIYDVVVSNVLGSVTSVVAHLSVCGFTVSPLKATVPASGGETNLNIIAGGTDCIWYTQNTNVWLNVNPPQGQGSGQAMVFVQPNPGPSLRVGKFTVAGRVFQVTQLEPPGTLQFSAENYPAGESAGFARLTVLRSNGAGGAVSVNYATHGLSATDGADYRGTNRLITFAPGVKSQTIVIPILGDYLDESNEVFTVTLNAPTGGAGLGARSEAKVAILDNDSGGAIRFKAATFSASEAGRSASVTVIRTGGLAAGVTVEAMTHDGSAKADEDYTSVVTNLIFAANQTMRTFAVPILNDTLDESNETFTVMLGVPTGGATNGLPAEATVKILDDDVGGAFAFASPSYVRSETSGVVNVTVLRTGGLAGDVSVELVTSNHTAVAEADFVGTNLVLHFVAGQRSTNVAIGILDDPIGEDTEKFFVRLQNPTGGAVLGATKTTTVSLLENETVLRFSLADYPRLENGGAAVITVTRTGPSKGTNTVAFATGDGSALFGLDYRTTNGFLRFLPGIAFRTFTVPFINDTQFETNEVFHLQLTDPTGGAVLGVRSNATVTIRSEDRQ